MDGSGIVGEAREVRLDQGVVRFRDVGAGPVLFFVHGVMANGVLWRDVVAALSGRFRCVCSGSSARRTFRSDAARG